jgi:hypothetical protein
MDVRSFISTHFYTALNFSTILKPKRKTDERGFYLNTISDNSKNILNEQLAITLLARIYE